MKPLFYTTTEACKQGDVLWVEATTHHPEFFICHPSDFNDIKKNTERKLILVDSYLIKPVEYWVSNKDGGLEGPFTKKSALMYLKDITLDFFNSTIPKGFGISGSKIIYDRCVFIGMGCPVFMIGSTKELAFLRGFEQTANGMKVQYLSMNISYPRITHFGLIIFDHPTSRMNYCNPDEVQPIDEHLLATINAGEWTELQKAKMGMDND